MRFPWRKAQSPLVDVSPASRRQLSAEDTALSKDLRNYHTYQEGVALVQEAVLDPERGNVEPDFERESLSVEHSLELIFHLRKCLGFCDTSLLFIK